MALLAGILVTSCSTSHKADKYWEEVIKKVEGDYISFKVKTDSENSVSDNKYHIRRNTPRYEVSINDYHSFYYTA